MSDNTTWHDRLLAARADTPFLRHLDAQGIDSRELGGGTLLHLHDLWHAPWYVKLARRLFVPPIHWLARMLNRWAKP